MRIALRSFVSHRIHSRLSDKGIWHPNSLCACRCSPNSPPLRPRTSSRRGSRYTRCHRSESTCDSYAAHPTRPHRGCRARPQLAAAERTSMHGPRLTRAFSPSADTRPKMSSAAARRMGTASQDQDMRACVVLLGATRPWFWLSGPCARPGARRPQHVSALVEVESGT